MHRLTNGGDHVGLGRRHVAVLVADLSGFTGLVESVDPEIVPELIDVLMNKLVATVHAHAGEIQHIADDSFTAVFGLRSPQGDEAVRAVRVGVALVSAATEQRGRLAVRVGIECGEVVVSPSWEPAGFAVWGHAVSVAKRLCDMAGPGSIHIGPRAFELAVQDVGLVTPIRTRFDGRDGDVLAHSIGTGHAEASASIPTVTPRPIGVGRRANAATGSALTRTESAVARLVAEGLSNPQIAKRLYISRHTAETHMKHIFSKLGVSSRAELAATVARWLIAGES
jgi:class 3 adenylate cyclase/DNA-binding CsgD family transcriptional regulator